MKVVAKRLDFSTFIFSLMFFAFKVPFLNNSDSHDPCDILQMLKVGFTLKVKVRKPMTSELLSRLLNLSRMSQKVLTS